MKRIDALTQFDRLPADFVVPDPLAAMILGIHVGTLKRTNPVRQIQVTERRRGRRVGDLRAMIRGEVTAA